MSGADSMAVDVKETLKAAWSHHRSGDPEGAEQECMRVLSEDPENGEALHLLGLARYGLGDHESARDFLERAAAIEPLNYLYHYNLGEVFRSMGFFADAVEWYEKAIALSAGFGEAHHGLGIVFCELGLFERALTCFTDALPLVRNPVVTLLGLGNVFYAMERHEEAAASFGRAIGQGPQRTEAYGGLIDAYLGLGSLADGLSRFRDTLGSGPGSAEILSTLGVILEGRGYTLEAADAYQWAVTADPGFVEGYNNLGVLKKRLGRYEEAEACFVKAIALKQDCVEAHNNLGVLCYNRGRFDEAKGHFRTAVDLKDDYATGYANLGMVLAEEGLLEPARACYARADAIAPDDGLKTVRATILPVIAGSGEELDSARRALEENIETLLAQGVRIDDPIRQIGKANFYLAYQGFEDREIETRLARFYERVCPALHYAAPHCRTGKPPVDGRKIRIGFLSRHLKDHTVGKYMKGILAHLNKDLFEVHTFLLPHEPDGTREFVEGCSRRVIPIPESVYGAREIVAAAELDILFYPDIGMEPLTYFLAFSRLAPVQCVFYGHPMTTGIGTIDYFVSHEDCEVEGSDGHYSETLMKLSGNTTYACYYRPPSGDFGKGRADFGIAGSTHLYLCAQSLFKVHPDFDVIVKGILDGDPIATVAFFEGKYPSWAGLLMERLERSVGEKASRICFLERQPYEAYLNLLYLSDVMLDTVHFNGGATTFDALSVGTPIVTLPGEFMRGRQTYALYKRMGVMECVAATVEEYIEIALRLGADPSYRARVKGEIIRHAPIIFEDAGMVRDLEARLIEAVEARSGRTAGGSSL
jgi:protein O-GlcNAc transferase